MVAGIPGDTSSRNSVVRPEGHRYSRAAENPSDKPEWVEEIDSDDDDPQRENHAPHGASSSMGSSAMQLGSLTPGAQDPDPSMLELVERKHDINATNTGGAIPIPNNAVDAAIDWPGKSPVEPGASFTPADGPDLPAPVQLTHTGSRRSLFRGGFMFVWEMAFAFDEPSVFGAGAEPVLSGPGAHSISMSLDGDASMPAGWFPYVTEAGVPYFYHPESGVTQWERPSSYPPTA